MTMKMKIATLLLPLVLFGCGGDDGDSSPQVNTPTPDNSNPSLSLVAKQGHDFSTNYQISLDVALADTTPAFLMVYTAYQIDPVTQAVVPTLSSKVLNVNLDQGKFDALLKLGKQVSSIVVQVLSTSGNPNDSFIEVLETKPDAILTVSR